jgi:hypothetical protein
MGYIGLIRHCNIVEIINVKKNLLFNIFKKTNCRLKEVFLMEGKKGDLSLSVNAIVIFVLAFAMLGVGLFISNMVKDRAGSSIDSAFGSLGNLEQKPDATNTITLTNDISIKQGGLLKLNAGFYNKQAGKLLAAKMVIDQCIDEENIAMTGVPTVSSSSGDIEAGTAKAFNLIINLGPVKNMYEPKTYTCTLMVCNAGNCADEDDVYDSKDFFMVVTG